ncbi:S-adenosyl-methyltransferase [Tenacibaculum holothuriorum]|uniref:S-adenosyl-methyltransferase n=1 Tax=Tenacibaculum holothuriorum TaxID=1635173 RepID=A0A1Y2PB73_9FLAO|nr:FtsL-like putative cell division protein [Tenacibaculum holothuriorum]OSY87420.1 S-adenosyl-methyltransferase [Tenacibaculum holothuriorum]
MNSTKSKIYDVLKGRFLTDESSFKNWRLILFVVVLLLIMITSAHRADQKVLKIAELNRLKRQLRAEFVDTGTTLMRMKLESSIRDKVKTKGLNPSKTPPQKIKVTVKKD